MKFYTAQIRVKNKPLYLKFKRKVHSKGETLQQYLHKIIEKELGKK